MFAKALFGIVLVAFCASAVSGQARILTDNGIIELNPLTSLVDNAANILHGAVGGAHGFLGSVGKSADSVFSWFTRSFILEVLKLNARLTELELDKCSCLKTANP
ncbi:hypothetical protein L596_026586 [Steinernema carpocapsae]|uniref:Uncharacterized protein n=1 Tax=Steinernema carpocapsae TaxID=34508 RepID=A0A4U5M1T8_STECR|nr:hypothetical protein L596_026586 [Steinernema carpocapsae]